MADVGYQLRLLKSVAELRHAATAWDELWRHSGTSNPTAQAEPLAHWLEHFAPNAPLRIAVVSDGNQMLAALPLLGQGRGPFRFGVTPGNCWSSSGTLLVDATVEPDAVLDCLVRGLGRTGWPLLRLDAAMPESPAWREFAQALERAGMLTVTRPRCRVDRIDVDQSWQTFLSSHSHNQRRQIRRLIARLGNGARLRVIDRPNPDELACWLRQGFAIEHQGWKGRVGTSVLSEPGMFEFYLRQAAHFAETGQLQLVFLEHRGQPIAFEYGFVGNGVYSALKVAYDEIYRRLSPGQSLRALLVEQFCEDRAMRQIDFLGPSSRATRDFGSSDYPVDRWLVALRPVAVPVLKTYRLLAPLARALRREPAPKEAPPNDVPADAEKLPLAPQPEPLPA